MRLHLFPPLLLAKEAARGEFDPLALLPTSSFINIIKTLTKVGLAWVRLIFGGGKPLSLTFPLGVPPEGAFTTELSLALVLTHRPGLLGAVQMPLMFLPWDQKKSLSPPPPKQGLDDKLILWKVLAGREMVIDHHWHTGWPWSFVLSPLCYITLEHGFGCQIHTFACHLPGGNPPGKIRFLSCLSPGITPLPPSSNQA